MTIHYSIRRADVLLAYGHTWRHSRNLKLLQLITLVFSYYSAISLIAGDGPRTWAQHGSAGAIALCVIAGVALYPLLRFKPEERMLEISPQGISTTIGRRSGNIAWREVQWVKSDANAVYIVGRTLNSFRIPEGAFATPSDRDRFVKLASDWLQASRAA